MELTIDFETRSDEDIKNGAQKYASAPRTEVTCMSLKVDDEPSRIYVPQYWYNKIGIKGLQEIVGGDMSRVLYQGDVSSLVYKADEIEAHNCEFEEAIWRYHMEPFFGVLPVHKLRCSAVRAAMCSLPRSLAEAIKVLGLPVVKDEEGRKAMLKICKPQKSTKKGVTTEWWHEEPSDYITMAKYCLTDTDAERGLSLALPALPPRELELWQLDQRMNREGVMVDVEATEAWIREIQIEEAKLMREWDFLTQKQIGPRQTAALPQYFRENFGVDMPDFAKDTVADTLAAYEEGFDMDESMAEETLI
jgi:DNA polymerase bacteriophage-type